ncbi:hypothetical protein B0H10DRAFT_1821761 [Mycena sp. CBHHK59/15]|nr:hypothetical protein B0H10DRAFT_1821761 [Mycena sp. CBHHK59/15]
MYVRRSRATEANPDKWAIAPLASKDEFRKTLMEANVLLWAMSIMTFTYSFINHFIANAPDSPPFDIPEVRIVDGGITGPIPNTKSTICRSYLVEEMIDEEKDGFYKFISNGDAIPVPQVANDLSSVTEFLSFTQHVQYHKARGAVYLSDLQGIRNLLTDPQIMTAPSIGEGLDIFGDGNVPAAFNAFPQQHMCNKFCHWFQLPALKQVVDDAQ